VKRQGEWIWEVPLPDAIDPKITYSQTFEFWAAATNANLDLWRWEQGLYPRWFMAKVVAFYRLSNLVEAHKSQAVVAKQKREAKKRGRRR